MVRFGLVFGGWLFGLVVLDVICCKIFVLLSGAV